MRGDVGERGRVERYAGALDLREDKGEREFDRCIEIVLIAPFELGACNEREPAGGIGVGGGIVGKRPVEVLACGVGEIRIRARRVQQMRRDHRVVANRTNR